MHGTGLKVCVGGMVVCNPILFFSFVQAEQKGLDYEISDEQYTGK